MQTIDPYTQKPKEKVGKFLKGDTNNDTSSTPKNNVYEQKEEHSDNDRLEDDTTKYE